MKSWPKLTESEQREWKSSLGKLKGFDFRPKESLCRNITSQAPLAVEQERTEAHKTFTEMFPGLPDIGYLCGYFANPTDREWKKAIAHCAVEACRGGYILFALAPDLAAAEAGALMVAAYRDYLKLYPPANRRQRARPQDWLALISAFEDDVARGPKTNPQIFAQYRRVLDGIRFAQARPRV
jgi:hypothetical protein